MNEQNPKKFSLSKCMKLFKTKNLVNVINLEGVIGGSSLKQGLTLASLNKVIENSFEGKGLKAVVLNLNSPGGSPVQSELIGKRIEQLSKLKNIPVIAVVEDMAASGGYWIACAASEIIVAENALVGSLGVRFSGFGLNKLIERLGIDRRVYTKGESKAMLDPFLSEKQSDIDMIMKVQDDIYQNFKSQVHKGRSEKLKIPDDQLFSGAIWSGKQAIEIGLADKIGDLYSEMQDRFGIDVQINIINQEKSWLKRKLGIMIESLSQVISDNILNLATKKIELR